MKRRRMIIKLQLNLFNSKRSMLVYNRDMSVYYEAPAPKQIVDMMDGELKAFFYSKYNKHTKQREIRK